MINFSLSEYIIIRKESICKKFPFGIEMFDKMYVSEKTFEDDHLLVIKYDYHEDAMRDCYALDSLGFKESLHNSGFKDYCLFDIPNKQSFPPEWFDLEFGMGKHDIPLLHCKLKGTEDTESESELESELEKERQLPF